MLGSVDAFRSGDVSLPKLVEDLQGLMAASDLHDQGVIDQFWNHLSPIDGESELRTERWAPPGEANDKRLDRLLAEFTAWVNESLTGSHNTRT